MNTLWTELLCFKTKYGHYYLWSTLNCLHCLATHTSSPPSSTSVQFPDPGPDPVELWLSHGFRCPRNSARCLGKNKQKHYSFLDNTKTPLFILILWKIRSKSFWTTELSRVYLVGDIKMVRACINCCIPQLVPQTWIWGKNKYIQLFSTIYMTTLTYRRSDLTWRKWAAHLPTPAGQHRRWYRRYRRSSDPPTCRRTATWNHQKKQKI